ncbi:MAG: N-acetylornithine carbamoyltransferase [bacterium]|jgi:N-acetylornithine carbamoyltransferase|nr:N-acetylornithine carbamoyltransferase [Planctomycetota bacterium]HIL51313.1 N-acetylornithine carbamoyltransferase [Planctomycetota bacterium]
MVQSHSIRHLISLQDISDERLAAVLERSLRLKEIGEPTSLAGRSAGMLFFRRSLRTRTSFEAAVNQLGGHSINLNASSDFWELEARTGTIMDGPAPEHIKDAAAVLSRYLDVLAIRPAVEGRAWQTDRRDEGIWAWAQHAGVPVINMESALWHPLQALADLLTLRETLGELKKKRLAICWTHSPTTTSAAVVHSLLLAALRHDMDVRIAHPRGYDLDSIVLDQAAETAGSRGCELEIGYDREAAAEGAHVVYARSWQSLSDYGNPTLSASHRARTREWQITEDLMARGAEAHLMHAMPVRRNLEVSDEVLDGPRSLMYLQAENRLHSQKALLLEILGR